MGDSPAELHVVTGAFGYSCRYIARTLLEQGKRVRTLTRHRDRPNPFGDRMEVASLDLSDTTALVHSRGRRAGRRSPQADESGSSGNRHPRPLSVRRSTYPLSPKHRCTPERCATEVRFALEPHAAEGRRALERHSREARRTLEACGRGANFIRKHETTEPVIPPLQHIRDLALKGLNILVGVLGVTDAQAGVVIGDSVAPERRCAFGHANQSSTLSPGTRSKCRMFPVAMGRSLRSAMAAIIRSASSRRVPLLSRSAQSWP